MPVNYTLEIDGRSGSAVMNSVGSGSSDGAITSPTITTDAKDTATKTIAKNNRLRIAIKIGRDLAVLPTLRCPLNVPNCGHFTFGRIAKPSKRRHRLTRDEAGGNHIAIGRRDGGGHLVDCDQHRQGPEPHVAL